MIDARSRTSETSGSSSAGFGATRPAGFGLLVVDHDRPKLEKLASFLRASDRVGEVDTAVSAHRALLRASRRPYDGVFLDMRMPERNGLEIISILNAFAVPPGVVVVSESDTYVAAAFRLGAIDYLIEPVTPERANVARPASRTPLPAPDSAENARASTPKPTTTHRARTCSSSTGGATGEPGRSCRGFYLYLQAYGDYVRVFADSGRYLIRGRLTDAAVTLGAEGFLRVHRKYLANLRRATGIRRCSGRNGAPASRA